MPSGKTHDRITLWMLPLIVGACYIVTRDGELTLLLSGGFYFSGLMFGPDLDIYSIQFKRWGILRDLWLPYRRFMRHRSFLSHGFIIGTVIRVIYLSCWLIFAFFLIFGIVSLVLDLEIDGIAWTIQQYNLIKTVYKKEVIALFLGLEIGAMSHYISDETDSFLKKRAKRKNPQPKPKRVRRKKKKKQ